jgi:hypothetical protein
MLFPAAADFNPPRPLYAPPATGYHIGYGILLANRYAGLYNGIMIGSLL